MLGPLLVAGIEVRIVAAGRTDPATQVIGDNEGRTAAEEGQRPAMTAQPVRAVTGSRSPRQRCSWRRPGPRQRAGPGGLPRSRHQSPAQWTRCNPQSTSRRPCGIAAGCAVVGRTSAGSGHRTGSSCNTGSGSVGYILPTTAVWSHAAASVPGGLPASPGPGGAGCCRYRRRDRTVGPTGCHPASAGSGQLRCRAWARLSSFCIPPTLSLVLRLMSRMDRPAACRSRSTSRSLRIVVLLPGMVGSSKKERAYQRVTSSMR